MASRPTALARTSGRTTATRCRAAGSAVRRPVSNSTPAGRHTKAVTEAYRWT